MSSTCRFLFFLGAAALLAAGCGGPVTVGQIEKTGAEKLGPDEILQLVSGNTLYWESFQEDLTIYLDGSRRVYGVEASGNRDQGRWDVSSRGELCVKFDRWWFGDLRCFTVYPDNKGFRFFSGNGALVYTGRRSPGNPAGLRAEVGKGRKSYRPRRAAMKTDEPPDNASVSPPVAIIEEEQPGNRSVMREEELKSTVKWMARDCPGCNLTNADLKKADLVGARLKGARLKGANLRQANLRRADLRNADLSDAVLAYANMPGADLRDCNLRNADLTGANLIKADLTGADLEGAQLKGAHLEGVKGLK